MEVASRFVALPARPPTPPKDIDGDRTASKIASCAASMNRTRHILGTPDESPVSSPLERLPKRVDFLPCADHQKLQTAPSLDITSSEKTIRTLPPSRECKPSRSILKAHNTLMLSDPAEELPATEPRTFPRMLEEITKELVDTSRLRRLDAYKTLNLCLKTFDDLPDTQAMEEKMPLLEGFIRRDLSAEDGKMGVLHTQLKIQVVKLVTIFLWSPTMSDMLQDDFRSFILDQSITMVDMHETPKALVNHYLLLLATQTFRPKIMNPERASRLLTVLNDVTNHVKGNGVVGQRLMIYKKLLGQSNPLMTARVNDWIDHLFSGLLSNIKDVRIRALSVGFDVSLSLGTQHQVSRAVLELLNRGSPDKPLFVDYLANRLNEMVVSKNEESLHVPQIWCVVILFLRSRRSQLQRWEHLRTWLGVLQNCFNSSDSQVRFQTNIAWNRLIFAIGPDAETSQPIVQMLRKPIKSQIERTSVDKYTKQGKHVAFATYCTLVYYAFRPGTTHAGLDMYWETFVEELLPLKATSSKVDLDFSCQVLASLLGDNAKKPWNNNRANDSGLINTSELPSLDARWIRMRAKSILEVLGKLLLIADWEPLEDGEAWILRAWRSFTVAVGEAGSKEVKVSMDGMTAVAEMINTLKNFWSQSNQAETHGESSVQSTAIERLGELVNIAVLSLGPIPFSEKRLAQNRPGFFEAAETPSSRSSRPHGVLATPINLLIGILVSSLDEHEASTAYEHGLSSFIDIALRPVTSRQSKLKVLREIVQICKLESPVNSNGRSMLWAQAAIFLSKHFTSPRPSIPVHESPQPLGQDYREAVKILEVGALLNNAESIPIWITTFMDINNQVLKEVGVSGSILAIIEPISRFLLQQDTHDDMNGLVQRVTALSKNASWLGSLKEVDRAHRAIWGTPTTMANSTASYQLDNLLSLVDDVFFNAYDQVALLTAQSIIDFMEAICGLITSCPSNRSTSMLSKLHRSLSSWVEDRAAAMIVTNDGPALKTLFSYTAKLWTNIANKIQSLGKFDCTQLSKLEPLLIAAFASKHRSTLNESIVLWNNTFGLSDDLEYSDTLRALLVKISSIAEIQFPGIVVEERKEIEEIESTPFEFVESQEEEIDEVLPQRIETGVREVKDWYGIAKTIAQTASHMPSVPLPLPTGNTPKSLSRRPQANSTPTRRLRHDDSQVHFAAIESSPIGSDAIESQLLTDRQKEVRERQQRETAKMFPDVRSSSRQRSLETSPDLPRPISTIVQVLDKDSVMEEGSSPSLPSAKDMTPFLGSSPTPGLRRIPCRDGLSNDDPPSSPPVITRSLARGNSFTSSSREREILSTCREVAEGGPTEPASLISAPLSKAYISASSSPNLSADNHQEDVSSPLGSATRKVELGMLAVEETVLSETEISVDAPASAPALDWDFAAKSPQVCQDAIDSGKKSYSEVQSSSLQASPSSSFQASVVDSDDSNADVMGAEISSPILALDKDLSASNQERGFLSDHEAQISAQIASDMNRALSQGTEDSKAFQPLAIQAFELDKKRKRISASPSPNIKKRRKNLFLKKAQVTVERPAAVDHEEEMLDCIIVASPRVTRLSASKSPQQVATNNGSVIDETEDTCSVAKSQMALRRRGRPRYSVSHGVGQKSSEAPKPRNKRSRRVGPSSLDPGGPETPSPNAYSSNSNDGQGAHEGGSEEIVPTPETERNNATNHVIKTSPSNPQPPLLEQVAASEPAQDVPESQENGEQLDEATSGQDILSRLKQLLEEAKTMVIAPGEGREILSTWMDLGKELHGAESRRA